MNDGQGPPEGDERATKRLVELLHDVPGIRGALVASVDGYPLAHHLPGHDAGSTAAIVASSCGLGQQLASLVGDGTMREIVVHSDQGYVVIYTVGDRGVLTVLTQPSANLARLHLRARDLVAVLADELLAP